MYKLLKNTDGSVGAVLRIEDSAVIPFDPANTDYAEYLKWLDDGNTPLPADEPDAG
jgi:hypothetical protein